MKDINNWIKEILGDGKQFLRNRVTDLFSEDWEVRILYFVRGFLHGLGSMLFSRNERKKGADS